MGGHQHKSPYNKHHIPPTTAQPCQKPLQHFSYNSVTRPDAVSDQVNQRLLDNHYTLPTVPIGAQPRDVCHGVWG